MHALPYWRLAGVYFFYFAYLGAFAPYFSLYLSSLGIAAGGIGVIMALPQLVRIFAPHLWGWLADRGGHRLRVARMGTVIGTAIYCGLFAARGFEALFAVVLLMSFFLSAALPQVEITTLPTWVSAARNMDACAYGARSDLSPPCSWSVTCSTGCRWPCCCG